MPEDAWFWTAVAVLVLALWIIPSIAAWILKKTKLIIISCRMPSITARRRKWARWMLMGPSASPLRQDCNTRTISSCRPLSLR